MSAYIGRFAPSPTGPLHFGSLLAALASYLDARHHHGQWLVRIEDLDPPREDPHAAHQILTILEAYQLHWDSEVRYQSQRSEAYQQVLEQLIDQSQVFPCACSRKQLNGALHSGVCQLADHFRDHQDFAWRFAVGSGECHFDDQLQGHYSESLDRDIGDFVVKRRDGPWSYQLAVVADDADQKVTHVVRGIDLIDSTLRQQQLQRALGYAVPQYAHIPVALETNGQKLSKQNLATALQPDDSGNTLWNALHWLNQSPPDSLRNQGNNAILEWAVQHWNITRLAGIKGNPAPAPFLR
ncbi:tRNA glutamyl-Q(34) synthetase GluQRS [Bacterioplanoides sp.]|uniref:tRNA glutamyl-Q(34) synthetase GluQRS n=1 Tax=Bacterioplanoides sp. TaxID=2066072 RepID=UPI003AFF95E9